MTVVMIEGFDIYNGTGVNTGLAAKWTTSGAIAMQTGRLGGQCFGATSATSGGFITRALPASYGSVAVGYAYRTTTLTTVTTVLPTLVLLSGATAQVGLRVSSDGSIVVYRLTSASAGTALGASAPGTVPVNVWVYIEAEITISDTVGVFNVYVNGVSVLSLSAQDTRNGAPTTVDTISMGNQSGTPGIGIHQFDDLYVTDSAAKLGERRIETLYPTSDVAAGWTPFVAGNNFGNVDEATVNGDTDYVQASVVGTVDTYGFGDLTGTPTTIDAVQFNGFGTKTDATSRSVALQVKSGATTSDGSNYALAIGYTKFERLMTVDPNGSIAWTAANVNALQGGPKVTV